MKKSKLIEHIENIDNTESSIDFNLPPQPKNKKVLGIDPGLQNFGYAIIDYEEDRKLVCAGEILTQKEDPQRLVRIFESISDVIRVYDPDLCMIERTFVNSNPFASLNLGQARGIVLLCFQLFNKKYIEVAPTRVKKNICGKGVVTKSDIQSYVRGLYDVSLGPNAADAVAIALCAGEKDFL